MRPVLFEIPLPWVTIPIHAYGFFIMLGFVVGSWVASRRGPRVGIPSEFVLDLSLWVMVAGIVGSRLFYVAQYHREYSWRIFDLTDGGMDVWGGVIGWLLPLAWLLWRNRDATRRKHGLASSLLRTLAACFFCGLVLARGVFLFQARKDSRGALYDYGVLKIWNGGIVFYGGLAAAVLVAFWYIHRHRQSILAVSDLFIPEVALGYAFARIGCFLNGCCFGRPTEVPWAIRYPGPQPGALSGSPAWEEQLRQKAIEPMAQHSLPVHPSQIYAAIAAVAIFLVLSWVWQRNRVTGKVLAWFGLVYPVYRFLVETTRGDEAHVYLGMTISQFISVCMFAVSAAWMAFVVRKGTPAGAPSVAVPEQR